MTREKSQMLIIEIWCSENIWIEPEIYAQAEKQMKAEKSPEKSKMVTIFKKWAIL